MSKKHVLCFLTVLLVLLSSCENFMKGSSVKDELNRLVEQANSPDVELYFYSDSKEGVVAPNGIVSHRKGQTFPIVFIVNSGYRFLRWEVLDRKNMEPVTDALVFENPGARETKATLVRTVQNLYIHPVCVELPRVVSFYPAELDGGVYANTPVRITFNMPVTLPAAGNSFETQSPLVKIFQTYPATTGAAPDLTEFYEEPYLSQDGTMLVIIPKAQALSEYIHSVNAGASIKVAVNLNPNISASINGVVCSLYIEAAAAGQVQGFTYSINENTEHNAPEQLKLFATRKTVTLDDAVSLSSQQDFPVIQTGELVLDAASTGPGSAGDPYTAQDIYDHMTGRYIYIYGEYKDPESGFDTITIEENHTHTKEGIRVASEKWTPESVAGLQTLQDTQTGITRFCLKYELKSDDGAINLRITPSDLCGNVPTNPPVFTVIKSTSIGLENVEPFNWLGEGKSEDETFNDYYLFDEADPESQELILKRIRIAYENLSLENQTAYNSYLKGHELKEKLYKNVYLPEKYYSVYCSYVSGSEPEEMKLVEEEIDNKIKNWQISLDVDSIEGLEFTVYVNDILGNSEQKTYQFPGRPTVVTKKDNIVFFTSNYPFTEFVNFSNSNSICTHFHLSGNSCAVNNSYIACKNGNLLGYPEIPEVNLEFNTNIHPDVLLSCSSAGKETGIYKLTLDISESFWHDTDNSTFDSIFVMYRTELKKDSDDNEIWDITEFEQASLSCTFNVETTALYKNGITADIFGKKENTITKLANFLGEFRENALIEDNTPPEYKKLTANLDTFLFDIEFCSEDLQYETYILHPEIYDAQAGLDYVEWWTENNQIVNRIYKKAGDDSLELMLPNWDMDLDSEIVYLKSVDNNENCSYCEYKVDFHNDVIQLYSKDPTQAVSTFDRTKFYSPNEIQYLKTKLAITSINEADDINFLLDYNIAAGISMHTNCYITDLSIGNLDTILLDMAMLDSENEDYYFEIEEAIKNKFLKFVMLAQTDPENPHGGEYYYGVSDPVYCYVGELPQGKTGSGYALWFDNGGLISSDMPVYIETLVTKKSKTECEQWDIQQWLHHRMRYNPAYVDCSDIELYEIYEADYEEIEKGSCYVLVAHFCDGTVKKSPVYQR